MKIKNQKAMKPIAATLQLKHQFTGQPMVDADDGKPITVTLVGPDSKEFFGAMLEKSRRDAEAGEARIEELDYKVEDNAIAASSILKGWTESQFGEFSKEAAFELFNDWEMKDYVQQILQFAAERANFFGK